MNNTISDWNQADHIGIYTRQLKDNPLYYHRDSNMWIAYSYEYCRALLLSDEAHVPEQVIPENSGLSAKARLLITKLARISNDGQHEASRQAAMLIHQKIFQVDVSKLMQSLLNSANAGSSFDFVETVAKRLPILVILTGLGISGEDEAYISSNLPALTRVMLPVKTAEDIGLINAVVDRIYDIAEKCVIAQNCSSEQENVALITCNLIGLFIQCYDGGRGLLCNALLNLAALLEGHHLNTMDDSVFKKLVTETLRLNPPVHNTRRVIVNDISLGSETLKAGETVLIVLAAANIDPGVFHDPLRFDINRTNNDQHLTFGLGGHNCIAKYLSIRMAADTCKFLTGNYQNMCIRQQEFSYEPQLNVRLVRRLMLSIR